MARLLLNSEWYEQVPASAMYETDVEALILQNASQLFPEFIAVPFKKRVYDQYDGAQSDLALIHKNYREWWVVEVEMGRHSLHGHVLPQVTTLARAAYDLTVADALAKANPVLDRNRLIAMLKGEQPRVLVVVDSHQPSWLDGLHRVNALVAVFEIFRNEQNKYVFRVNGEAIPTAIKDRSECLRDPRLPGLMLKVQSPGIFDPVDENRIVLKWRDSSTEWSKVDAADSVWLVAKGPTPDVAAHKFYLIRREDGAYELTEMDR